MQHSSKENNWGRIINYQDIYIRARIIDILLLIFATLCVIIIIYTLFTFPPNQPQLDKEIVDIYASTIVMLIGIFITFILKRWISVDVASVFFVILILISIVISDVPSQVAEGRTLIFFTLPIVLSSVLIRPWGSFVFAGLSSLIVAFIDINILHLSINYFAFVTFFTLAISTWLITRTNINAINYLFQLNEKTKIADEEICSLAKFPEENPNPVMRINHQGQLIYANKASQTIRQEWHCEVGKPVPLEWRDIVADCLLTKKQKKVTLNVKNSIFSLDIHPIAESNYVNIYGRDETERIQGENALRESEQRYRQLFDTMHDGFSLHEIICDDNGKPIDYRFLEVNSAFERVTGLVGDEIIGKTVKQVLPETESIWIEKFGQVALTGKSMRFENYSKALDKYFEVIAYSPRKNQFAVLSVDITERKRTEIELQKSRERERTLADILEHASQPFAAGFRDGRLAAFNTAFSDLLGYSSDEIQSFSWIDRLTAPEWRQSEMEQLQKIDATGMPGRYEKEYIRKDGSRVPVELLVHLAKDEQENLDYYYAFITDLTERKKAEQEVLKLNLELEQRVADRTEQLKNTLTELESFAYSVSHDLRAPLRAIDGFSQALSDEYSSVLTGDGLHYLDRVRAGVKRMDQLISDLLKLSRVTRQEINYEQVDLSKIAHGICNELKHNQPERTVDWEIMDGMKTNGDASLLKIAIENLMLNAWKFTSKNKMTKIQFGCMQDGDHNLYFLRDNGVGFDMNYASKLFGAFQRLHSAKEFPGTGIGLATVQRIIHRHGGKIWAESSVNQGAVFYFTLGERTIT